MSETIVYRGGQHYVTCDGEKRIHTVHPNDGSKGWTERCWCLASERAERITRENGRSSAETKARYSAMERNPD